MVPKVMQYSYKIILLPVSVICVILGTNFNKVKKAAIALPAVIPPETPAKINNKFFNCTPPL